MTTEPDLDMGCVAGPLFVALVLLGLWLAVECGAAERLPLS